MYSVLLWVKGHTEVLRTQQNRKSFLEMIRMQILFYSSGVLALWGAH